MLEAAAWYVAVQLVSLAAWPLVSRAFVVLDDRGWGLSKVLGIIVWAWLAWLASMLSPIPYTRATLLLILLAIGVGAWLLHRAGPASAAPISWFRSHRGLLFAEEAGFLLSLALFGMLRAYEPAIVGTEKPMDMAFLNGFIAATNLPTGDTWLAGYGVPYYYMGYFLFASVAKLSGVSAAVAYNLAAASVPALAAMGLGSLAWNVCRAGRVPRSWSALAGVLAPVMVLLGGNLSAPLEMLVSAGWLGPEHGSLLGVKEFAAGVQPGVWPPPPGWWWRASRVAPNIQPDGINEFPFFSILLSDLHPHFMALPIEAVVLGLIACHVLSRGASLGSIWTQGAAAWALGSLLTANTWDIAPFWVLYCGAAWVAAAGMPLRRRGALVLAAPFLGVVLYSPYFIGYASPPLGIDVVRERLYPSTLLVLFGSQVALLLLLGWTCRQGRASIRVWVPPLAAFAIGLLLAVAQEPTLGLLVFLAGVLLPWPGLVDQLRGPRRFALLLASFSAVMLLGVELIYLRDTFGSRMNTVFKFHYNVWVLATLAGAVGIGFLATARRWTRWVGLAVALSVVCVMLVYPVSAMATRLRNPPPGGPTLNGFTFLGADERAAVDWLRERTAGTRPIIVEAVAGEYSSGARMATYSGSITILGWAGHQLQWRGPIPELSRREADVAQLYRATESGTIAAITARYGADYIVVGDLERQQYGPDLQDRFDRFLPIAFRAGRTTLYLAPRT